MFCRDDIEFLVLFTCPNRPATFEISTLANRLFVNVNNTSGLLSYIDVQSI